MKKWPGAWKATCDVCGFEFYSDEVKKRWDGLIVCEKDFETRHPQDFVRAIPDRQTTPWSRPEQPDVFIPVCTLGGSSGYAGLAVAGCAIAGNNLYSISFLTDVFGPSLPSNTFAYVDSGLDESYLLTEDGDFIFTEDGNYILI